MNDVRMARLALLDHVPIPAEQIHTILCDDSPTEAARRYEATTRSLFANGS